MFDGIVKTRREICMSTLSGCNSLQNPETGEVINILTGCKNMPAKGGKICKDCVKMCVKHKLGLACCKKVGSEQVDEMLSELPKDVLFVEEICNQFRSDNTEVLVKFLGDPYKK